MRLSDAGSEWLRLTEHYRRMTDEELSHLARDTSELTESAQRALSTEMSVRGLKVPVEERPPRVLPKSDPDSPYAKERELVVVKTVWSQRDALQLQTLLDQAGIPFSMGDEMATGVDEVTSDYTKGVNVRIPTIGISWARSALAHYEPKDEPAEPAWDDGEEITVPCPKCRSTEVILDPRSRDAEDILDEPSPEFEWTCEACGHHWKDDGVVGKKAAG